MTDHAPSMADLARQAEQMRNQLEGADATLTTTLVTGQADGLTLEFSGIAKVERVELGDKFARHLPAAQQAELAAAIAAAVNDGLAAVQKKVFGLLPDGMLSLLNVGLDLDPPK